MAERGLGAGLGALFGSSAYETETKDFITLPITKVEARADQPRKDFDEASLEELAESIKEHGIISPITVRLLSSGYYQIIAGERRWRAARKAGLNQIPARVVEADNRKAMEIALVENLQREDLNPIEAAQGYSSLMEEHGLTQDEIGARVGLSRSAIANTLRLLALPESIRIRIAKGELSAGHARAVLQVQESKRQDMIDKIIAGELSVRQAETLAKRLNEKTEEKNKEPLVDYYKIAAGQISEKLGRKVRIVKGKRKGRIELDYYGPEDLEKLIEMLSQAVNDKEII